MRNVERLPEERVGKAENGRRRGHTDREKRDGNYREPRRLGQHPKRVTHIAEDEHASPPFAAIGVIRPR
jgi:hypothetical protein